MLRNETRKQIFFSMLVSALSLFVNGFGIHLTIRANIGAGPWDVFSIGLSRTFGILYGTASIAVSVFILTLDLLMREPIGISMIIDAVVVGKSVDFFNWLDIVPIPHSMPVSVTMILAGLVIIGVTQCFYMKAALGCGPRDTLLVGLSKRCRRIPIGAISIGLLGIATLSGYLLGGPVGIGTLLCAFATGPIMQAAFHVLHFDAAKVTHQRLSESAEILLGRCWKR